MSFLNSVLSSIGGNTAQSLTPPIQPSRSPSANSRQVVARAQNTICPATIGQTIDKKRKSEHELQRPSGKVLKHGTVNGQTSHVTPPTQTQPAKALGPRQPDIATSPKSAIPYRGTSKPNPTADVAANGPTTRTPTAIDPAKAPKKGSYAEIMARAKASQSKPPTIGVISHKPKDKTAISYKKELRLRKKAMKNKKLGIKEGSRPGSSGSLSSSPAAVAAEKPKPPQPAYKGTAKPKPEPNYKGTMKAGPAAILKLTSRDRDSYASRSRYNEYAATDEEDLGDVEEDDYGSEESDDMEAGFSDVEQEESAAAKAARKEDEEEAKLEAKLKSEKEERKKRLEAMAKKAKPQRY